jgi:hypothetical protein
MMVEVRLSREEEENKDWYWLIPDTPRTQQQTGSAEGAEEEPANEVLVEENC